MVSTYVTAAVLLVVVATGGILAATPWLMRSRECFAVTVPAEAQSNPLVRRLKRRYASAVGLATGVVAAAMGVLAVMELPEAAVMVGTLGAFGISLLSVGLMLCCRSRVRALKERHGWRALGSVRSAVISEGEMPCALSLWWQLLNVPVILLTLAIGVWGYGGMPDMIPVQVNLDGEVTRWVAKGPGVVAFAPIFQTFMVVCFGFSQWGILHSKKAVAPDMPVASAYAYGMFARAQSTLLVVMGLLLTLSCIAMQLSMIGLISIVAGGLIVALAAVVSVVGAMGISVVYGQSGARLMARVQDQSSLPYDDDRYWKLGLIYVNPNDPSLFVPARFGIGWTNNFGRPLTWVILVVAAVVVAAFVVATVMLL